MRYLALSVFLLALGNPGFCLGEDTVSRWTATLGVGVNLRLVKPRSSRIWGSNRRRGGLSPSKNQSVLLQYYFSAMPFNSAISISWAFLSRAPIFTPSRSTINASFESQALRVLI